MDIRLLDTDVREERLEPIDDEGEVERGVKSELSELCGEAIGMVVKGEGIEVVEEDAEGEDKDVAAAAEARARAGADEEKYTEEAGQR